MLQVSQAYASRTLDLDLDLDLFRIWTSSNRIGQSICDYRCLAVKANFVLQHFHPVIRVCLHPTHGGPSLDPPTSSPFRLYLTRTNTLTHDQTSVHAI